MSTRAPLITFFAVPMGLAAGCAIGFLAYLLYDIPPLRLSAFTDLTASSIVYGADHSVLGRFARSGDRRMLTRLDQAGKYLPAAFIAAEDKDFYRHIGIDPFAIVRSTWNNIRHASITSGASTITQQTVKLALFPRQERTIRRKIQEMVLSIELERHQTKSQILLEYMNSLYFGTMHGVHIYGVESAALHAFGRRASELTPAQAAFLAAIPNNPSRYSIRGDLSSVMKRQRWILDRMWAHHDLSTSTLSNAKTQNIASQLIHNPIFGSPYESKEPYVVAAVQRMAPGLIAKAEHISELQAREELETGGYRIYTSIDPILQNRLAASLHAQDFPAPAHYRYEDQDGLHVLTHADEQSGAIILQNNTSRILALGGGRDFSSNEVNHALIRRQPGSSLKPLIVYGPAIETGLITTGSIIDDIPRHYYDPYAKSGDWFPQNWDHQFHGLLTVRDALMQSYNEPAIETLSRLGTNNAAAFAQRLGFTGITPNDAQSLGLAIGGIERGVTSLELANAYATLASQGVYTPYSLIDRIENAAGLVIYDRTVHHTRVFSPGTAYLVTSMLQSVIQSPYGTAHLLKRYTHDAPVAGKTGTTDDNKDAWFVGYTTDYTMSIWVGYDIPHSLSQTARSRETLRPIRIFGSTLGPVIVKRKTQFANVPGYHAYQICTKSGALAGPLCKAAHETEMDVFSNDTAPSTVCQMHRLVLTTMVNGKKVLATELTPVTEIRREILIERPQVVLDDKDALFAPLDLTEAIPHDTDPRGGFPLYEDYENSTTVTPLPPSP